MKDKLYGETPADLAREIYKEYERGIEYLSGSDYFNKCDEAYGFFIGDQWREDNSGEKKPAYNVLRPIVDYKLSMVAQNGMSINYSTMNFDDKYEKSMSVCGLLNRHAAKLWEKLKMDTLIWDIVQDACVVGGSYIYFYDDNGSIEAEQIDSTNILFSDEQQKDIQRQKYIIIAQRLNVADVREAALKNGISEEIASLIVPDGLTSSQLGKAAKRELHNAEESGKCLSLLKLYKKDGTVHITRSVKNAIYQPETKIEGMKLYPIAGFCWMPDKGTVRGVGEVYHRIANQTEINKALVRLLAGIKQYAFPHIVYDNSILSKENVSKLGVVGSNIGINNAKMQRVGDVIQYLQPAQINPLAREIVSQIITQTRELAGAGDAVTGQINPEKASGAAIIAVRDAAALPLNRQVASCRQFAEDIAKIWYDMWIVYNPNGMDIVTFEGERPRVSRVSARELRDLNIDVRIDVSPMNPYSKYAKEEALQRLFSDGVITFEEFADSLDDDSAVPKDKLLDIVNKRKNGGSVNQAPAGYSFDDDARQIAEKLFESMGMVG